MAETVEKKKKGSFFGMLILLVIVFIAGVVVGRTQVGWEAERMYHLMRYSRAPIATDFVSKPFELKIEHRQNEQGALETYLANRATYELLPVYEISGTTQVGKIDHRMAGLKDQLVDDAKEGGSTALEKAKQLFEFLEK